MEHKEVIRLQEEETVVMTNINFIQRCIWRIYSLVELQENTQEDVRDLITCEKSIEIQERYLKEIRKVLGDVVKI